MPKLEQQQLNNLLNQQLNFATDHVAYLLWGLLFSSIGLGYFIYGKRQSNFVAKICGLALMLYPYFIYNAYLLVILGILIMAVPFFWRE